MEEVFLVADLVPRMVFRGCMIGVKPSAETVEAVFLRRRGESPSIDLLFAIVYNYTI